MMKRYYSIRQELRNSVVQIKPNRHYNEIGDFLLTSSSERLPDDVVFDVLPMQYVYDSALQCYAIYNPNTGDLTPNIYTKDDVLGMECCAVWYDNHIEDRLFAHYEGKECPWLKMCGKIE